MLWLKSTWAQLKYLVKHKIYVGRECFKHGLYWQGLVHDLSKFSKMEWTSYRMKFFEKREDIDTKEAFQYGWSHHIHKNPHHWEHYLYRKFDGTIIPLKMPDKYAVEMLCDWVGAGIANTGRREVKEWYQKNKENMILHPITRMRVEYLIGL